MNKIITISILFIVFYCRADEPFSYCDNKKNDEFVECVFSLPLPMQKKYLALLSAHRRKEFLRDLTVEKYEKFLDSFSEYEWRQLLQSLSEEEQRTWPKTVEEQKIALKDMDRHVDRVKDAVIIGTSIGYAIFPPTLLLYCAHVAYREITKKDHVKDYALNQKFVQYLREKFNVVK